MHVRTLSRRIAVGSSDSGRFRLCACPHIVGALLHGAVLDNQAHHVVDRTHVQLPGIVGEHVTDDRPVFRLKGVGVFIVIFAQKVYHIGKRLEAGELIVGAALCSGAPAGSGRCKPAIEVLKELINQSLRKRRYGAVKGIPDTLPYMILRVIELLAYFSKLV